MDAIRKELEADAEQARLQAEAAAAEVTAFIYHFLCVHLSLDLLIIKAAAFQKASHEARIAAEAKVKLFSLLQQQQQQLVLVL